MSPPDGAGPPHLPRHDPAQADVLEYYLRAVDGVTEVKVYDRDPGRGGLLRLRPGGRHRLPGRLLLPPAEAMDLVPEHTSRALNREFEDKLTMTVARPDHLPAVPSGAGDHGAGRHPVGEVHPGGAFGPVAWPPVRGRAGRHRRHRVHGPGRFRHRPGP